VVRAWGASVRFLRGIAEGGCSRIFAGENAIGARGQRVVRSPVCATVGRFTKLSDAGVQGQVCNRRARRRVVSSRGCATVGRVTKASAASLQARVCNRRTRRRVVSSPGCAAVGELTAGVQPRL